MTTLKGNVESEANDYIRRVIRSKFFIKNCSRVSVINS